MRTPVAVLLSLLLYGIANSAFAQAGNGSDTAATAQGGLQVEIQSPSNDFIAANGERSIEVEGVASRIGGVRYLDMIFVMDTSSSLRKNDPGDFRSLGAIGLIESLSPRSDIKIGIVSFDGDGDLAQALTSDRDQAIQALRDLPRSGRTNIAAGILTALAELEAHGRPESSRVIMLFTDGQSSRRKAHSAAIKAHARGVTLQTLLLGKSRTGGEILDEIAWATGGSLVRVEDPAMLPEAFLNLKTTGVDSVMLSANGSEPIPAQLAGGTFIGTLPLTEGDNRIVAFATSIDGQTRESVINVTVRDASCAALEVAALKSGRPVLSLNDKAVEIVVDASRSMWGQIAGEAKMSIAKDILEDVTYWNPDDLNLALRAYGSNSPSESNDCADSSLLVPFGEHNRESIRYAIAGLRPTGQTPIAFALNQASSDFSSQWDDRALVLVTDGIESCGGNPVRAARDLREQGITVHLIGFGLGNAADEDTASLQAVANASGGRYVTAGSAAELQDALAQTVATSYSIFKGSVEVASGSLASDAPIYLPEGDYRVQLHDASQQNVPVSLAPRDGVTLTLEKDGGVVSHFEQRQSIEYRSCEDVSASIERLEARQAEREPYRTATE